jgi:dTDP-4-amino-4,6-dideoxygalactose transaminase
MILPSHAGFPPWQTYPVLLPHGTDVGAFRGRLLESGLETRRYYFPPLHTYPLFGHTTRLPVAEDVAARALCLPIYSDMRSDETSTIIEILSRHYESLMAEG